MATVRSVDFLPEIFQTDANKQFLRATLDQLIQEPQFKKTQGFIGRTVGPGVNPNDNYVIEPDKTRAVYQLEPGVVSLEPDTDNIKDVLTYPGLNDAIGFQGGNQTRPDRLYSSEYYTWDPFVDFDAFVNFSQYFWVPGGPQVVDVAATAVPATGNFVVTRENGVYTFSGISGENPVIELVRGGSYTFQVAQNNKETVNYRVRNQGNSAYVIDFANNPTLTLQRGNTYVFNLTLSDVYPFWIKTAPTTGLSDVYSSGVQRNGATTGLVTFTVPQNAPDTLYYAAENQSNMHGTLNIVDGVPGTGPGFWFQAAPGVAGVMPATPNISSRDVYGVENNGEDLGTIVFNVPYKTAQSFYYNLNNIGSIDLITDMKFNEINNQSVAAFIAQHGGIDGITNLNGRTLVFTNPVTDIEDGGWLRTFPYDPLVQDPANNGLPGSFDSGATNFDAWSFDAAVEIPPEQHYQKWQITYVNVAGQDFINLSKIADIDNLDKFTIGYGTQYSNTQWYKNNVGTFEQVPLLTAIQDTLYYQDGTDPEIFGRIKLLDQTGSSTIFIEEILGKTNYTSPNGVVFTNGLKVRFQGDVEPASYASGTATITCTATEAGTNYISSSDATNLYVGQQISFSSPTLGGIEAGQTYYVRSIAANGLKFTISAVEGGPAVTLAYGTGTMTATTISNREYYVAGVGSSIELLPTTNFVTPESYVVDFNDSTIVTEPADLDYLTINRASKDLNAWTRSNRWFHIDVINAAASYNNTTAVLDNNYRAKRPIIQFRPGIRLWNMGTEGKAPVDIIDFEETDAFSNIEGSTGYSVDGYTFVEGTRVIFAADTDADVRNKIYIVSFVTPDTVEPLIAQPIITLTLASDGVVSTDQSVVCLDGNDLAGLTFWYNGTEWIEAQQKTGVQQAPLFNIYDVDGVSFGDGTKYQSTTFEGSKLFSYAASDTTIIDPVLQFPLKYLNINNVGDIVFDNNLYVDTFLYVVDNVSVTSDISSGSAREYNTRTTYQKLIGWQTAVVDQQIYQQFKFTYTGATLKLDVAVNNQTASAVPVIKIYVGSEFQDPSVYSYTTTADSTTITLTNTYLPTDVIEVLALSDQTSQVAFYQVPNNLESNPLNANSPEFTLGTIRTHYQSICENLLTLSGPVNGANNTRDLGDIIPYGLVILQQSAPLTLAGYFMRAPEYNIFASLQYNSREYIKYKAQMLDAVLTQNIGFNTTAQVLDTAIQDITLGKVDTQPFYWSDMLPSGAVYTTTTYTVSFITTNVFDTINVYNYTSANYLGMLVYINDQLLTRGVDYTVATDGPRITILTTLNIGDVVTINEYTSTAGSFIPNTPTKLGLYPAFQPEIITQVTSNGEETAILGHDGSITKTFGDIRDEVLLEFEKRIYSNLKLDGNPVPLTVYDVLPGQFRDTGFTYEEINQIFGSDLLSYCGWNKLDYKSQTYSAANEFTYNYSSAVNKLNGENLLGAWRGIYRYFYDTQQPSYTPWEMLGFSVEPTWWADTYGPAPYTSDNLVLWDDLEAGYVRDPITPYTLADFARPGLTQVIPTGTEGQLLSPLDSVVNNYDDTQWQKSWALGDGGPVEASWWNSSGYPFSVMHVLAVTRPAKFFALFADRDLYKYNTDYNQYLYNNRYRLDANGIEVYGDGVSKASYINWIVDYNRQSGLNSTSALTADLQSLDVRLCYRMASFSDKQYIKLYTEKSSPNSTNTALLIPDESYDILLYKNQPFDRTSYSSVVVQRTDNGYAVFGYGTNQPYFNILQSQSAGKLQTISITGVSIKVPTFYTDTVVQVPYGFVFSNETSVADFLLSYGKFMERQGLSFDNISDGYVLDWNQMVQEFLYWSQQGWGTDALINLNPLAKRLTITREQAIVDNLLAQTSENLLLDQNSRAFAPRNLNIVRSGDTFSIEPLDTQNISYIDLRYTTYEHMIVLNNQSVFGDLIYDPITGARQSRLNLIAVTSTGWDGNVNAPGFILNQNNVEEWTGLRTYSKGEIVKYKNVYWSALTIVQPSDKFDFNVWTQSDYTQIELGLLPNISNKANQLANSYNINTANIESDNDLLSYGLIGFRPRQYMAALNLNDVSQLNIYRQFLGTKGTILAAELFKQANLGKEAADYDIYENWAVQRSVYGANANRSFVELRLNRALLNSNPSLVQVVIPQESSLADQQILLENVWRQSYKLTSPDFLPTTTTLPTDIGLPTAGYVNLDDADLTVFDITDTASLDANIDSIEVGTSVWVAKINNYDWNIYRAQPVPGTIQHVCDNLNGTSRVIFSAQHGLSAGDKLIINFFDIEVNGVYQVLSVPNLTTVNIAFQFTGDRTVANGLGLGFTLQTMRVAQASDVINLPYANDILPGAKVWVDDNGSGLWEVLEKNEVFSEVTALTPYDLDAGEQYGASIAQAQNRLAALVGSPKYGFGTGTEKGAVYVYVKNYSDQYTPVSPIDGGDAILTLDATGVRGYGNAVDFGNQTWAVAGASASLGTASLPNVGYAAVIYRDPALGQPGAIPYAQWQLLTPPTVSDRATAGEFGYSVAMSLDERWMYIGAPGVNKVHAYGRVDWQDQFVRTRGDGVTKSYSISDKIQINADTQLKVTLDGRILLLNTDYTVTDFNTVVFATAPGIDVLIDIQRIYIQQLDAATYYEVTQTSTSGAGVGAKFTIVRVRNEVGQPGATSGTVGVTTAGSGYSAGNTITFAASKFGGQANLVLTITSVDGSGGVVAFTIAYTPVSLTTVFSLNEYFFTVDNIYSFSIIVDGVLYRPHFDYTFDTVTKDITFTTVPAAGTTIIAEAQSYFEYVDSITTTGLTAGDRFGESVACTTDGRQVIVGTPDKTVGGAIATFDSTGTSASGTGSYAQVVQNSTSGSGYGAVFSVSRSNNTYTVTLVEAGQDYAIGDTITISGSVLGGTTTTNDLTITVATLTSYVEAGSVYVFDRNVQRFIYGTDSSSVNFTVLGTVTAPVSVIVNNQFLINETNSTKTASNTFTWNGANTVTLNTDLQTGDIVEIETNQFKLIQEVTQETFAQFCNFGTAVDICSYNCSLYVGEPQSSVQVYKGGAVERSVNQSRIYGTITATVANPSLDNGDTLRVNNIDVVVPGAWSSLSTYSANVVVYNTDGTTTTIYKAIQNVPAATALTNTTYWSVVTTTTQTDSARVRSLAAQINIDVPNVNAVVSDLGYLTLTVKNSDAAPQFNKLQVAPGSVGTTFADLGFETFAWTQTITSPYPVELAGFGSSISIDDSAVNLVVGAPRGTLYLITIFDEGTTIFDVGSTTFFTSVNQSGAIYTYDYLPSATLSITNPGKFVFGDQVSSSLIQSLDQFGTSVNYTSGVLMAGAPKYDYEDSTADYGSVFVFENPTRTPAWTVLREQQPVVDVRLLNSVFLYDRITSATTEFLDFINPLQGKILGAARANIDYIGAVDPAAYNVGPVNIRGTTWNADHVGEIWWDISSVRFIDPNQDNITYASRRWSQLFPGSTVNVYQWIVSNTPPASYTGEGTPLNNLSYTVNTRLSQDGTFATEYYFWVSGITSTSTKLGKTLPPSTIANYIADPRASGIPYIAAINGSTIALYNSGDYIEAEDTIINIEFDRELTNDNVHVEYELIPQDRADGFLSSNLYRKLQDSFCGVDTYGNNVPDPNLGPAERYGVQFRPRQSMFVDRFEALRNYFTRANNVFAQYTISENRSFALLNSSEPEPSAASTSDPWNMRVANLEILGFQNIYAVPLGYKYLVATDSNNRGLWTIYTVQASVTELGARELVLTRVQLYYTPDYWSYIDWYRPGYNSSTKVIAEVPTYSSLGTLTVPVGSSVKITANAQGKWEIYLLEDTGWSRVGLQDGTIELSAELWNYALGRFGFDVEVFDAQYFDQEPVIETRKIIQAINEELFIDDLAIERNKALVLMFNYILSEFSAPEWLVKTSLVDVDHRIRDLVPYQNYIRDNQEFVSDYIQEVKPYHVQVREFNLKYTGFDEFFGDLTDFDVPAYYNTSLQIPQYTSPILLPYDHGTAFNSPSNTLSDLPASSTVWESWPYSQWYSNYLLQLDSVTVVEGGTGYTEPPVIIISGEATEPAEATAVINSLGQVVAINVTNAGSGYRSTPTVVFDGGNGTGARAYAVMASDLVRSFRTIIKYDRCQYVPSVQQWSPDGTYQDGMLVRYDNRVWQASSADSTAVVGPTFDLENWTLVNAGTYNGGVGLTGVDRTMGLYVPGVNQPGLELPLLIDGVDYPGVQVYGDYFLGNPASVDATYESAFTDTTLGETFTSVNVDGGEFVGLAEGHAPEELVNGAEFDTLDMRIYTRPGADWSRDGHGFQIGTIRYTYDTAITDTFSWAGVVDHPVQLIVSNLSTGQDLLLDTDYTIDWDDQTVTLLNNIANGEIVNITVYELGGGSQLYRANYTGAEAGDSVIIPVNAAEINNIALFVNGENVTSPTWVAYAESETWNILNSYAKLDVVNDGPTYYRAIQAVPTGIAITNTAYWFEFVPTLLSQVTFAETYGANQGIALVAFGTTTPIQYSWSTPQVQYVVADGALASSKTIALTNSLQGTNPANLIVERNGYRLRPAEGIEWIGDDSSVSFGLPQRGGYQQSIINAPQDVTVWVDNVLQTQASGATPGSYSVSNWTGSNTPGRQVVFTTPPAAGARILISVDTAADYALAGTNLELITTVNIGDVFSITTWNDTAQQNILTLVFQGPVVTGLTVEEPYDSTVYDLATVSETPGSYDYAAGVSVANNDFYLERGGVAAGRLWVTLDGQRLFEGVDFTVEGEYLILSSGAIGTAQVLAVTEFTESTVPESMAFRIFQDMRGVQATYRITAATTTTLAQDLSATADVAYVTDANALSEPNLEIGIFGAVTIDGERIMYRERNTALNTISGLRRGTAGTGAAVHSAGAEVYDIGRGNLLAEEYQDYYVSDTSVGDGSTTVFYAPSITIGDFLDSSSEKGAIEVYVGGVRQYAYADTSVAIEPGQYRWFVTDADPVAIDFVTSSTYPELVAPPPGVEVTIRVRQGTSWYQTGPVLNAGEFVVGEQYIIITVGTTDFTAIGASSNHVGVTFTATGVGSGSGTAGTCSDGVALQDTQTVPARFLRGL